MPFVLHVTTAERTEALAGALASVLRTPPADPMAPEWIVVVSAGMDRWLRLELARHLGASGPGATDGVAANLDLLFPGSLTRRVLHPGTEREADPWGLESVAWVVLELLEAGTDDERLGPLRRLPPGATRWSRARRVADLFDRYLTHRPEMIRLWAAGNDVDGSGVSLGARARWQPHLWRLVRARIAQPSPPELLAARLTALRDGDCPDEVPERISLFGLSTIPGGGTFLELLDALGTQREVHLLVHHPSAALAARVRRSVGELAEVPRLRTEAAALAEPDHPLLRSWARPAREAAVLLGTRPIDSLAHPDDAADAEPSATLLARLQADVRADRTPEATFVPPPGDRSIQLHSCHGPTRQVEVLRDQILHLLAEDDSLTEDDIVVLCPALDEFAPWIESVLGPPAGSSVDQAAAHGPPALAYRITDRSLRSTMPLLGALGALVELLASRVSDAAVLDFADLAPVRARYSLTDGELAVLANWVQVANTRWGLDGEHRARFGIPAAHEDGSWRTTLDRLLLGIAVSDDPSALAPGEVLPIAVEGSGASLAGRVADLLGRIAALVEQVQDERPIHEWLELLRTASGDLFAVDAEERWQEARLRGVLEALGIDATLDDVPCDVPLSLADVRHLLGRQLGGTAGRSDFFRGGVTISSLTPLRSVPYRAVLLLGMDETAFASGAPDGDDLVAANAHLGDRDRRADARQALLEAVAAAQEHLVLIRTGRSVVTNQPVPDAVVVAELLDAVRATVVPEEREALLERLDIVHPRQGFDERNFLAEGSPTAAAARSGPWSFDPTARTGAEARQAELEPPGFLPAPLAAADVSVIELADLHEFLAHPPKHFLQRVLDVALPSVPERRGGKLAAPTVGASGIPRAAEGRELVLTVKGLDGWGVRDALLAHLQAGGDVDAFARRQRAAGHLPPGRLAAAHLDAVIDEVTPLLDALRDVGALDHPPEHHPVDITLADGTRVVGTVRDDRGNRPGPVTVTVSAKSDKQALAPWLDVVALTAHDPTPEWRAVYINANKDNKSGISGRSFAIDDEPAARGQRALDALAAVVDLYRRGQREPLPIFPKLSPALHKGTSTTGLWTSDDYRTGDDADPWIRVAFEHATEERITTITVGPDDPQGTADGRAQLFASALWGTIAASAPSKPMRSMR